MQTQLPFFGVIRVSGDDRHEFLHNQLSNDINHLMPNQACYATYNTPKGRVIANMIVLNLGDCIMLILAADLAESVAKRLKMFVLRAKVQLAVLTDWGVAGKIKEDTMPIYPEQPHLVLSCNEQEEIELPHLGNLKVAPKSQLPAIDEAAENVWNAHEIESGYPWICAATTETCVAQMLNQHIIGGVHFRKGCYPGQEIIARAQYRGQVKRGLAVAHSSLKQAVGAKVVDESGEEVGLILNVSGCLNLLVLKHSAANSVLHDESGHELTIKHLFFSTPTD